ncbi:sulfatase family protein [Flammeovirga aprica]|uniref:Sulfatase n=1 Tax=Flammeovirga aprica JL-4 TaxID=694437 RepID=A0A7X9RXW7_9BACT|nr:sulfatase [Flammeovirga aprica]NME70787.1 sulfatase [Flammeovirga aprica JL-4]
MKVLPFFTALFLIPLLMSAQEKKPNILYIMSDDHTSQAIGVYGSRLKTLNPTPNLDKLANEGVLLTNTFCTNSICTPSRATILTGQYSQTNGVLDLEGRIAADKQYLPKEIKKLGYQTAIVGKWHLKEEPGAFDYYKVLPVQGKYFDPVFRERGEKAWPKNTVKYKGHSSDIVTDISIEWLDKGWNKEQPFFLMHHFKAPHDFFEFAPRYKDYLEDVEIPEPASLYDNKNNGSIATYGKDGELRNYIGSSISKRNKTRDMGRDLKIDQSLEDKEYTHASYQEYLKRYLRCVKGVDDNIKRLLDHLDEIGELDNTIIVYTSDQGMMLGEHDYQDKRWMYEESMRMPFIAHFPKNFKKGIKVDAIINNTDFAPTLIDLAGGKTPKYMHGESFKSILETGKEPKKWRKSTYYRYWMHMAHKHGNPAHFGVRTKDYKLIFFYSRHFDPAKNPNAWGADYDFEGPIAWEFYDLSKDPHEMNNAYDDPKYSKVIADLKKEIKKLRKKYNEEDGNYPKLQKIIEEHWDDKAL